MAKSLLTSQVRLPIQGRDVRIVTISNSEFVARSWSLVVAIIRPSHPVQRSLDSIEVSLSWMEVGNKEYLRASGGLHLADIDTVASERRHKYLVIDTELGRTAGVLPDLLANSIGLVDMIPIEIKGNEHFHVIVCSGVVCKIELGIGVRVDADVQRKGVDSQSFGLFHIIVIIGGTVTVARDTNLVGYQSLAVRG